MCKGIAWHAGGAQLCSEIAFAHGVLIFARKNKDCLLRPRNRPRIVRGLGASRGGHGQVATRSANRHLQRCAADAHVAETETGIAVVGRSHPVRLVKDCIL